MSKATRATWYTGIGVLGLVGAIYLFNGKEEPVLVDASPRQEIVQRPEIPLPPKTYVVQPGDYLSRIAFDEGARGRAGIYDRVREIQGLTWSEEEIERRDTHYFENGELLRGKDGLADLIYPEEVLTVGK